MVKLSLIHEENVIHKLCVPFQPSAKLYMVDVISWEKMLHFLDMVSMKTITLQSPPCLWSWNTSVCRNFEYTCMWALLNSIECIVLSHHCCSHSAFSGGKEPMEHLWFRK